MNSTAAELDPRSVFDNAVTAIMKAREDAVYTYKVDTDANKARLLLALGVGLPAREIPHPHNGHSQAITNYYYAQRRIENARYEADDAYHTAYEAAYQAWRPGQ